MLKHPARLRPGEARRLETLRRKNRALDRAYELKEYLATILGQATPVDAASGWTARSRRRFVNAEGILVIRRRCNRTRVARRVVGVDARSTPDAVREAGSRKCSRTPSPRRIRTIALKNRVHAEGILAYLDHEDVAVGNRIAPVPPLRSVRAR